MIQKFKPFLTGLFYSLPPQEYKNHMIHIVSLNKLFEAFKKFLTDIDYDKITLEKFRTKYFYYKNNPASVKSFINTHNNEVMYALGEETSRYILNRERPVTLNRLSERSGIYSDSTLEILDKKFFSMYSDPTHTDALLDHARNEYIEFVNNIKDIMIESEKLIAQEQNNNPGINLFNAPNQLNKISSIINK